MSARSPLILVGWDGADWKIARPLMAAGKMPQLAELTRNGAHGDLASFPPYLSPMLWNTIGTGRRPDEHGITGFTTVDPISSRVVPVSSRHRRCPALWNMLSHAGLHTHVVGWFASHPAEAINGICVSEAFAHPPERSVDPDAAAADWPIPRGSVTPATVARELAGCRLQAHQVDPGIASFFVPRWQEIDPAKDRRLDRLFTRLAELYSVHNAALAIAGSEPVDCLAVYYHFIDWICHDFMTYHPPHYVGASARDCELYGNVVNAAYALQDLLLKDLLHQLRSDQPTVMLVSDHGFHSDHLRPARTPRVAAGIAAWHRPHGLIAAAGPGIAPQTHLPEARLLDIVPTVLTHFGLPAGEDMEGRVLTRLFRRPVELARIPTWDDRLPQNENLAGSDWTAQDDDSLLRQFEALGYVESGGDASSRALRIQLDNAFNLGTALLHLGRPLLALPNLEEAWFFAPESAHVSRQLARCQLRLGLIEEAAQTTRAITDMGIDLPAARFALAEIHLLREDPATALDLLTGFEPTPDLSVQTIFLRGQALAHLGRAEDAEAAFHQAVTHDPHLAEAWLALGQLAAQNADWPTAANHAQQTLNLRFDLGAAHHLLGAARQALGQPAAAFAALEQALRFDPTNVDARTRLAALNSARSDAADRNAKLLAAFTRQPPTDAADWLNLPQQSRDALHWFKPVDRAALRSLSRDRFARWQCQIDERRRHQHPLAVIPPPPAPGSSGRTLIIVTGLPRSGTSLMMQLLAAGGLPVRTDGQRQPSPDNPRGFFEWEAVKNLARNPGLFDDIAHEAVKIVTPLLPHLPHRHRYKIIFMQRPVAEVAASQAAMLARNRFDQPIPPDLDEKLAAHREASLRLVQDSPVCEVLEIDYPSLVVDPTPSLARLVDFIGRQYLPRAGAMGAVIDPALRRQRAPTIHRKPTALR